MNKEKLVEEIAKTKNHTKAEAQRWLDCAFHCIKQGLQKNKSVKLKGFGTFIVKNTKPRKGRNPRTGQTVRVKAGKKIAFRASKDLKIWV